MSFFWIAALNTAVRSRIKWLGGGGGGLAVVEDGGEVSGPLLLSRAASRLRTWLVGVQKIMHSCCEQGKVLVQVLGGSWRGVSVSVLVSVLVLVLVLVSVSVVGSMLNLS